MRIEIQLEPFEAIFKDPKALELQLERIQGWIDNINKNPDDTFVFVPLDQWIDLLNQCQSYVGASEDYKKACQTLVTKIRPKAHSHHKLSDDMIRLVLAQFTPKELYDYIQQGKPNWVLAVEVLFNEKSGPQACEQRTLLMTDWLKYLRKHPEINAADFLNKTLNQAENTLRACLKDSAGNANYRVSCSLLVKKIRGESNDAELEPFVNTLMENPRGDHHELLGIFLYELTDVQFKQTFTRLFAEHSMGRYGMDQHLAANLIALAPRCDSENAAELIDSLLTTYFADDVSSGGTDKKAALDCVKAFAMRCTQAQLREITQSLRAKLLSQSRTEVKRAYQVLSALAAIGKLPDLEGLMKEVLDRLAQPIVFDPNARCPEDLQPNTRVFPGATPPTPFVVAVVTRGELWDFYLALRRSSEPPVRLLDAREFQAAKQFIQKNWKVMEGELSMALFNLCSPSHKKELQQVIPQSETFNQWTIRDVFHLLNETMKMAFIDSLITSLVRPEGHRHPYQRDVNVYTSILENFPTILQHVHNCQLTKDQENHLCNFINRFSATDRLYKTEYFIRHDIGTLLADLKSPMGSRVAQLMAKKYIEYLNNCPAEHLKQGDILDMAFELSKMRDHLGDTVCQNAANAVITALRRLVPPKEDFLPIYLPARALTTAGATNNKIVAMKINDEFARFISLCGEAQVEPLARGIILSLQSNGYPEAYLKALLRIAPKLDADGRLEIANLLLAALPRLSPERKSQCFLALTQLLPLLNDEPRNEVISKVNRGDPLSLPVRLVADSLVTPAQGNTITLPKVN